MTLLRQELEAPQAARRLGSGWVSGVLALVLAGAGLGAVICLRYPELFTVADVRKFYNVGLIRLALHAVLISGFVLGIMSLVLRKNKVIGFTAVGLVLLAALLGGSRVQTQPGVDSPVFFGLDWFILNLLITGIIFIPIERFLKVKDQPIFRVEWREDLFYLMVSSLLVQSLTFLSLAPALAIFKHTDWAWLRGKVAGQPLVLQLFEIMFLTDLVQYWIHRAFHRIPFLWRFHAVHHSAESMDWLAGSRMHLMEIVCLRGCTVIPMYILGFSEPALHAYLLFVYLFSTLVHSNLRLEFKWLRAWFVTPRYHHWHHGIEKEAIDINFAVHFPLFDRLFGTHYFPKDGKWPAGYGISEPMPKGFWRQMLYPFMRPKAAEVSAVEKAAE